MATQDWYMTATMAGGMQRMAISILVTQVCTMTRTVAGGMQRMEPSHLRSQG